MAKRTVKIAASELTDCDVELISMVYRPASRVPFGLMKSEDANKGGKGMIDLQNIFKTDRSIKTVVNSVIINGQASAPVMEVLKAEGFSLDNAQEVDGTTIYPQDAAVSGEQAVIKLSDNLAVGVSLFKAEGSFAEACAQRGFYPGISIATDLLQDELYKAVHKSDSSAAAAEKITTLVGDFGTYIAGLIKGLPQQVFKSEQALAALASDTATAAEKEKAEPTSTEAGTETQKSEAPAGGAEVAGTEGDEAKPEEGAGVEKGEGEGSDKEPEAQEQAPTVDVAAIVAAVSKSVTDALSPKLSDLSTQVNSLGERVGQVEGMAKSADKAVRGIIPQGVFSKNDGEIESEEVRKGEPPLLDTGFAR